MFKRYFNFLRNYNRISVTYNSIPYKCSKRCLEKKKYISFNNWSIQQFNLYSSVASPLPLLVNTLENKVINLCICLRNGRVLFDDLDQIIQIYEETDYPLVNDVSLVLLKCCGELLPNVDLERRQRLTKRVWNLIQNKDCPLTLEHYNVLLAVYEQNSESINPQEFLDNMKIKPDENIYCSLLNVISKTEDSQSVSNIISKFGENLYSWNKETFDTIIKAHAMQGNIKEAYEIINKMQSVGITPSSESYLSLTFGFAKLGDVTNIAQIFEENQPSIEHLMKIVRILSYYGHGKHIPSILKFLTLPLKEDKLFIVNNTIIELAYSGQRAEALSIITNLLMDVEITDSCVEYVKCFVNEEIKQNTPDQDVLQVLCKFMHNKQFPKIINKATEIALSHDRKELALTLFEEMRKNNIPVRPHYYWPLLLKANKYLERNEPSCISHMISLDIEIDEDTFVDYVFPFMDITNPVAVTKTLINVGINYPIVITSMNVFLLQNNRIKDVISLCSTFKVKLNFHNSHLQNSLIEGYKKRTNMSTFVQLLLKIPYIQSPPFLYIINASLNYAKNFNELEQLIELLEILNKQKVKISMTEVKLIKERINEIEMDASTVETIHDLLNNMCSNEMDLNSAREIANSGFLSILSPYPHPNKMDCRELQNHIIELKNKNMNIRSTARKLLLEYCRNNNLKHAEELKQNILSNNFEWPPGMSALLFSLYLKNNLIDKAEMELTEIQNNFPHFQIDNSKVVSYATCLVKNNRLEDAFDAINNIKNVNKRVQVDNKCFQLLTTIADSKHYDSIEEMLETLVKNNYCKISNSILIPLFQRHLFNNDIDSIVNVFIYCVNKYKQTPLKQKIMLNLINNIDSSVPKIKENVIRVMQSISDVHGENVALQHLIFALAQTGQVKKLQKVFQTQNVNMTQLCHHMNVNNTNNCEVLFTIFKAIADMKNVPKGLLCELIISLYKENNNYDGATTLLKQMEATNVIPSSRFKDIFDSLQASNRQKIQN